MQIDTAQHHQAATSIMLVPWKYVQVDVAEWLTPRALYMDDGIAKQWASNGYKHSSAPHMTHLNFYFHPKCQPMS